MAARPLASFSCGARGLALFPIFEHIPGIYALRASFFLLTDGNLRVTLAVFYMIQEICQGQSCRKRHFLQLCATVVAKQRVRIDIGMAYGANFRLAA